MNEYTGLLVTETIANQGAEIARLKELLGKLVPHERTSPHGAAPGISTTLWRSDRSPALADAREALGLQRWPIPQPSTLGGYDTCEHPDDCGCGGRAR